MTHGPGLFMNEQQQKQIEKVLEQSKDNIKAIREALIGVSQSEEARKQLMQTEFDMIHAINEVKLIWGKKEDVEEKEEILPHPKESK